MTRPLIVAILAMVLLGLPIEGGAHGMPLSEATPTPVLRATPRDPGSPWSDNPESIYDGYWWRDETFVPGYISVQTWFTPAPISIQGRAVYYAPNVMEATAAVRGMSLKGYVDGVALMSPADIGRTVWIKRTGGWEGPFLVVDCARRGDMWPVTVGRGEVVEVGFKTAVRWGMAEGGSTGWRAISWVTDQVQVYIDSKPPEFPVEAANYAEWFLERADYVGPVRDRAEHIVVTQARCWKWWDGETYCKGDWRTAPWVRPDDYLPPWKWPTETPTATASPMPTSTGIPATPVPTPDWKDYR